MRSITRRSTLAAAAFVALIHGFGSAGWAQTWNQTGAGPFSWDANGNWTPAAFPNSIDAIANVNSDLTAGQTINLNTGITVGTLNLGDSAATFNTFLIAPATGSLTFDVSSGNANLVKTAGNTVTDTISAPVVLNDSLLITGGNGAGTGGVTLSGGVTGTANLTLNSNSTGVITLSTASVNNSGTITNLGTGAATNLISGGVGSNVTAITENSAASALTISTTGLTVNSGGTTLNNLNASGAAVLTVSSAIGGTGNLVLNNNSAIANGITLSGGVNQTGTVTNSGTGTGVTLISSVIGTNVTGVIQDSATSTLTLTTAANTFNTGLTIRAGSVSGNVANSFGANTNVITIGHSSGSANATLIGAGAVTHQNPISVASGNTGVATITSSAASVFNGAVTLNTHDLLLAPAGSTLTLSGGIAGTGNLTIATTGAGATTLSTGAVNFAGSITNSGTGAGATTISSAVGASVTGVTQNSATSSLTLSGANTYTGPTLISAGTLNIGAGAGTGTLSPSSSITNNGILAFNRTGTITQGADFNSVISGTGAVNKLAAGTLVLNGANTFTGGLNINGGIVSVATVGNQASASSNVGGAYTTINIGSGGTAGQLTYTGSGETSNRAINLAGTTGGATLDQSGAGLLKFTSPLLATGGGAKTLTLQGSTAGTGEIAGMIVDSSGATSLTKAGTGTWTLSGSNNFTGATTISGGVLQLNHTRALQNSSVTVSAANGLTFGTGIGQFTTGGLAGASNFALADTGATAITLLVGNNNATTSYTGVLSGAGSLAKVGTGTQTVQSTAVNTFSGGVDVRGGTLLLNYTSLATPTNIVPSAQPLTLSGGRLSMTAKTSGAVASSQTFTGVSLNGGGSGITATGSSATLQMNATLGTITRNNRATLNFVLPTAGQGSITVSNANDATGILGPWANVGSGTATAYAVGGGAISALAGTTVTNADSFTSATTNYNFSAGTTITASRTAHTARYTGAATTTDLGAAGANTLTLNGLMNVGTGLLTIQRTGGTGTVVIGSTNELVVDAANNAVTITAPISGAAGAGLTKTGAQALTLGLAGSTVLSSYTGPTVINQGTLLLQVPAGTFASIGSSSPLGAGDSTNAATNAASLVLNGGTLNVGNSANSVSFDTNRLFTIGPAGGAIQKQNDGGTLTFNNTGAIAFVGSGPRTLTFRDQQFGSAMSFAPVIGDGSGGATSIFADTGRTIITLTGNNTYTGTTTMSYFSDDGSISGIQLGNGGTSGTLGTGPVSSTSGAYLVINRSDAISVNNQLSGTMRVRQVGAGTTTLGEQNTYTGATSVTAGTLKAGVASVANVSGAFGLNSAVTMSNVAGATLDITGFNTQIGSLTGGGTTGGNVTLGAATLTVGGDNTSPAAFAGVISDSGGGSLTKIGTGTLILSGGNTYTGTTTISAGTVQIGSAGTTGALSSSSTIVNNGTLSFNRTNAITQGVDFSGSAITGTGGLTMAGAGGNLTLNALNTYSGVTTISNGTITYGANDAIGSGAVTVTNGTLAMSTFSDTVGTVTLTAGSITGSGTLTSTGGFTMNNGGATSASVQLAGSVALNKSAAGVLTLSNAANSYSGGTNISAGTINFVSGALGTTGTINFTGTSTLQWAAGNTQDISSRLVLSGGVTGTLDTQANIVNLASAFGGSGAITKTGTGTLTLGGANTYTGLTTVSAGTLAYGVHNAINTGGITVNGTGAVLALGAFNDTVGTVTLTTGDITGSGTLTSTGGFVWNNGGATSTSANLAGVVGLTKTAAGTATLTGTNTYTGPTSITAGRLNVNGSLAAGSAVTVSGTGILGGTGTVAGTVAVNSGGTIAPGTSPGALSTGATTYASGGIYQWEINNTAGAQGANPGWDFQNITGGLNITATAGAFPANTFRIDITGLNASNVAGAVSNWNPHSNYTWNVATASGGITGFAANKFDLLTTNFTNNNSIAAGTPFAVATSGNNLQLTYTPGAAAVSAYWDLNGNLAGAGGGAVPGTWSTSNANWSFSPGGTVSTNNWVNGDNAVFAAGTDAAGTYIVTVAGGGVTAQNVTFEEGATSVPITTITGGTLTLAGATPTISVAANRTAVIESVIAGTDGLAKSATAGTGTLRLTGLNTYTGVTNINVSTGIVQVTRLANGLSPSSIGQASNVAANLLIGNAATLQYLGSGDSTDRLFTINGTAAGHNATIDASGTGAISFANTGSLAYGAAGQTRTLVLTGSNTGANTFAPKIEDNGAGATSLTKSGVGQWVLSNSTSTFTGATAIQAGTLSINSIKNVSGGASALGAPTTPAGGTIAMGSTTSTGQLTYTGSGDTTDRVINLAGTSGGAILDQSGTGLLRFTSALTATGAGTKNLTLQGSTAGTGEISGAIVQNGTTTVTKAGTGAWTMSGTNTYTGSTTITGGTLNLDYTTNNTNKLSDTAALLLSGGTLNLMGSLGPPPASHVEIVASTTLTGANSVTRTSGGNVLRMVGITASVGSVNFSADDVASTTNTNTNGILGGSGAIGWATVGGTDWATNSGVLEGGGNNYIRAYTGYTDVTRLTSGPQTIADGSATNVRIIEGTGAAADIILGSATTTVNSLNQSASGGTSAATIDPAGQTLGVSSILVGSGAGGMTIGNGVNNGTLRAATASGNLLLNNLSSNTLTVNSVIANNTGTSTLTKVGSGAATLTATNTYSGVTTVNGGTLNANATGAIPSTSTINGGTLNANASGAIVGTATVNTGGTLVYGSNDAIANTANVSVTGGTVNIGTFSDTVNKVTLNGGTIAGTTGVLTSATDIDVFAGTASAVLSGSVNMIKFGGGAVTLSGANTFTGYFTSGPANGDGGTVILTTLAPKGQPSSIGLNGDIYHRSQSSGPMTMQYTGGSVTTDRAFYWNVAPGTTSTQAFNGTVGTLQVVSPNVTVELLGSAAWSSGANKFLRGPATGLSNLNFGTILLFNTAGDGGNITADPTLNVNIAGLSSGVNSAATTFAFNGPTNSIGPINFSTVSKTVAINGAGTTTLFGANNFGATTGQIQINNGVVIVTGANSGASMAWNVGSTGTLRVGSGGSTGTLSGSVINAGQLIFNRSDNNLVAANNISGAGRVQQLGSGRTTLSGTNTNTGQTVVTNGTLEFRNEVSLYNNTPASWTAANIVVEPNATLAFNVGAAGLFTASDLDTLKAIGTAAGGFKSGSYLGLDTGTPGGSFVYNSNIGNPNGGTNVLGLTKLGGNVLDLGGTNTYTGPTNVRAGTLRVTGTHTGGGLYTVDSAGTLGGIGSTTADMVVLGTLAPGASIESLGTGSITFDSGGLFDYELDTGAPLATAADLVYGGTGSDLTLNSALLLLTELGPSNVLTSGTKLTLIAYDGDWNGGTFFEIGAVGSNLPDNSSFNFAGNTWYIDYDDTSPGSNFLGDITTQTSFVTITVNNEVAVVPEPGAWALAVVGLLGLGIYAWRRK